MKKFSIVIALLIAALILAGCQKDEPLEKRGLPPLEPERIEVERIEVETLEVEVLEVETTTWG